LVGATLEQRFDTGTFREGAITDDRLDTDFDTSRYIVASAGASDIAGDVAGADAR
jgi:hypothetical protein